MSRKSQSFIFYRLFKLELASSDCLFRCFVHSDWVGHVFPSDPVELVITGNLCIDVGLNVIRELVDIVPESRQGARALAVCYIQSFAIKETAYGDVLNELVEL